MERELPTTVNLNIDLEALQRPHRPIAKRTRDGAIKSEVARFAGPQYVAERDGEDGALIVYEIHDGVGGGVTTELSGEISGRSTGDRARVSSKVMGFNDGKRSNIEVLEAQGYGKVKGPPVRSGPDPRLAEMNAAAAAAWGQK